MTTKIKGFWSRSGKNYTSSLDVPERVKMRSLLLFPILLCSGKVCRSHVKLIEKQNGIGSQKYEFRIRNRRIDSSAKWTSGALRATPRSRFGREAIIFVISIRLSPKIVHPRWGPLSHLSGVYGRARREAGQFEVYVSKD